MLNSRFTKHVLYGCYFALIYYVLFVFFKQLLEYFVEEYFDQNPISQVCRLVMEFRIRFLILLPNKIF